MSGMTERQRGSRQWCYNGIWSTVITSKDNLELWSKDDDLERSQIILSMKENLVARYNKWACICVDDAGKPLSCGYSESPAKDTSTAEEIPVTFTNDWHQPSIFEDSWDFWLRLDEEGQDRLYMILASAVSIKERIYYDSEKDDWLPKFPSRHIPDFCTLLTGYGPMTEMQISGSVLDHLARGRCREDLEKMKESPVHFGRRKELTNSWSTAFVDGMTKGAGCEAVSQLFKALFAVLDNSGCCLPPLAVLNTSTTKSDACDISTSSSTTSPTTPEAKRRKLDEQAPKEKLVECLPPKDDAISSQQFVDLSVATQDGVRDVPKYLVLVEILPRGETTEKAEAKFMKELIYVLQCQSEVFGLFFADKSVKLYRAKKDSTRGACTIAHDTYRLQHFVSSDGILHVAEFQRLIIDILTCLVYGINYIIA